MAEPHGAAVVAEGFGLKGPRGWVFRDVGVDLPPGGILAIEGPSGSGRTCLLLALTGRMRPTAGFAEIGGLRVPRAMAAVRRISALGPVTGVSELDPALTVGEHLGERVLLRRHHTSLGGALRDLVRPRAERAAEKRRRTDDALTAAGLDLAVLPKGGRTSVRDLERLEALRLSVALALVGRPRLLAVDDLDLGLSDAERAVAWDLLRSVAADGTTVVAVCGRAPAGTDTVRPAGAPRRTEPTEATPENTAGKGTADALAETGRA
ncbi:ATP-binding cassette domain-containing protein [Streptomyces niveus]|uniref:ATP-binding cassette domain-containing protein n=1 Tax=Streptomyces niveus TaxID=193462 RepID=UPI0036BC3300